jgi:hypothetical protein
MVFYNSIIVLKNSQDTKSVRYIAETLSQVYYILYIRVGRVLMEKLF